MANAFDAYQRARAGAMQQGQNMLAMEQAVEKIQRDRALRDILSSAYRPEQAAIPAMPSAPAEGPLMPGAAPLPAYPAQETIPAQAAGVDMQNALAQMYKGGFGPEAMAIQQKQQQLAGATPSTVNEWKFFNALPQEDQEKFLKMKRAQQIKKIGGVETVVSPIAGVQPLGTLQSEREARGELKAGEVTGKAKATAETELADLEANLPRLQEVVGQLSQLGKTATYTKAGQMRDVAAREAGLSPTEGAIARREYIAKVDNEILPLLRQTFGAAFTEKEGQQLKATLGDPNASPEEKDAVLRSFINSKQAQIQVKRRRVGQTGPKPGTIQGGYVFMGGDPAKPESWKKQ